MSLLVKLVDAGIVTLKYENDGHGPRCHCKCGGECEPNSIYSHVNTRRHQEFATPDAEVIMKECGICCQNKSSFFSCKTCRKDHCNDCHSTIQSVKPVCPFCRAPFRRPRRRRKRNVIIPRRQTRLDQVFSSVKRSIARMFR